MFSNSPNPLDTDFQKEIEELQQAADKLKKAIERKAILHDQWQATLKKQVNKNGKFIYPEDLLKEKEQSVKMKLWLKTEDALRPVRQTLLHIADPIQPKIEKVEVDYSGSMSPRK